MRLSVAAGRARRRTPPTPADRIHRMRRSITLLFTLVSALGLIGMTVFAVHADGASWRDQVDSDLQTRTSDIAAGLTPDEDGVLAYPVPKDGGFDCPPVTLFTAGGGHLSPVVSPRRPCLAVRNRRDSVEQPQVQTRLLEWACPTAGHRTRWSGSLRGSGISTATRRSLP